MLNAMDSGDFIDGNHVVYSKQPAFIFPNAIILFFVVLLSFARNFTALTLKQFVVPGISTGSG